MLSRLLLIICITCRRVAHTGGRRPAREPRGRHVINSHDMTNAFACTKHDRVREFHASRLGTDDRELFGQSMGNIVAKIDGHDGSVDVRMKDGGAMGDGNAPEEFLGAFHSCIQPWVEETAQPQLRACCPISGAEVDCSLITFADDLLKKHLVPRPSAQSATHIVEHSSCGRE